VDEGAERVGRSLAAARCNARHASSDQVPGCFQHAVTGSLADPPPSAVPRRTLGLRGDRSPDRGGHPQRPLQSADGAAGR